MNCPKCTNDMVEAIATNFGAPYWYCRVCKKELSELVPLEEKPESISDEYKHFRDLVAEAFYKPSGIDILTDGQKSITPWWPQDKQLLDPIDNKRYFDMGTVDCHDDHHYFNKSNTCNCKKVTIPSAV